MTQNKTHFPWNSGPNGSAIDILSTEVLFSTTPKCVQRISSANSRVLHAFLFCPPNPHFPSDLKGIIFFSKHIVTQKIREYQGKIRIKRGMRVGHIERECSILFKFYETQRMISQSLCHRETSLIFLC